MAGVKVASNIYTIEKNDTIIKIKCEIMQFKNKLTLLTLFPELYDFDKYKMKNYIIEDKNIEYEKIREYIVKKFLFQLISEIEYKNLVFDHINQNIISFWKKYINDFSEDEQMNILIKEHSLNKILSIKKQLFEDIIKNKRNKNELLFDQDLSPEILGLKSVETITLLNEMIEEMSIYTQNEIDIAIFQSGQGYIVDYLKDKLENLKSITMFDNSIEMLNKAKEKYGEEKISYELYDYDYVEEKYVNRFDHLFIVNTIHQLENPENVINIANLMLKNEGKLHLIDFSKIDSISLLVAIFFQEKYLLVKDNHREMFFYKKEYLKQIVDKYFKNKKIKSLKSNHAYYIVSENIIDYKNIINDIINKLDFQINKIVICPNELYENSESTYFERLEKGLLENSHEFERDKLFIKNNESDIKNILETIWKQNLGIKQLMSELNYFKLGGNSLSATKMVVKINNNLNCKISLKDIFEHPSFNDLLNLIQEKQFNPDIVEGEI